MLHGKNTCAPSAQAMQAGCNIYWDKTRLLLCHVGYGETLSGTLGQVKSMFSSLGRGTPSPSTHVGHKPAQHSVMGQEVTAELLPRSQSQTPSPLCAAPVSSRKCLMVKQRGQGWGDSSSRCSPAMPRWVQVPSMGKRPCGDGKLQKEFLHGLCLHTQDVQKAEGHHLARSPSPLL